MTPDPLERERAARVRTVVILQSNYIPWRGYFDLMRRADAFVIYDEVQYTKNDWRNRNQILTRSGPLWLTIPVAKSGRFGQSIAETQVPDGRWAKKHWASISQTYAKAPCFDQVAPWLERCYQSAAQERSLSAINLHFLTQIAAYLEIGTQVLSSQDIAGREGDPNPSERLVQICRALKADTYLSGPAAREYLDEGLFTEAGIQLDWMRYPPYPARPGAAPGAPASILDALFWLPKTQVFDPLPPQGDPAP